MKFIALHGLNADNQQFRFFINADKVVAVYPVDDVLAKRGYRSTIVLRAENESTDLAVTESINTVIKRLNGEKDNG